jgi:protein-L-isoaspartate(D-aspartate) O-methyltransferase
MNQKETGGTGKRNGRRRRGAHPWAAGRGSDRLANIDSDAVREIYASLWDENGRQSAEETVTDENYSALRLEMVERQLRKRGVTDGHVLEAMRSVPRHEFVPESLQEKAYADEPVAIGGGQTISQPYIVAAMSEALHLDGSERVLEIGTGCGYQAAVLSQLCREVFGVEYRSELARGAAERLERLGFANVHVHCGDGSVGLKEFAPYDAILLAAAAPTVPRPLLEQLGESGRLIAPIGAADHQELMLVRRRDGEFVTERGEGCRFVPLLGRYGWKDWGLL